MRRARAAVVAALTVVAGHTAVATDAIAAPRVVCDAYTKICRAVAESPGRSKGGDDLSNRRGTRRAAPVVDDGPSLSDLCHYQVADPQPPISDPVWSGHEAGSGRIYMKVCPSARTGSTFATPVFIAAGDAPPTAVTPAQLAQRAVQSLRLPKPVMSRSPSERNSDGGLPYTWVNLWTWYWTSSATWRPRSERATAGPVFAEVTVTPKELIFDPGNGSAPVSCFGPGRPWRQVDGNSAPSAGGCGYRYRSVTSGGPLTATLSIRWSVSWTGSGGAGGGGGPRCQR
jgi:hypothetical protein